MTIVDTHSRVVSPDPARYRLAAALATAAALAGADRALISGGTPERCYPAVATAGARHA